MDNEMTTLVTESSTTTTTTTRAPRSPNWSMMDDLKLCEAWLAISKDPNQAIDKVGETLWERIFENFKTRNPEKQRNASSLEFRWRLIKRDVSRFCNVVARVMASNPNEQNEEEIYDKAELLYQKEQKRRFKLMRCYKILYTQEKWISEINKTHQRTRGTKRALQAADSEAADSGAANSGAANNVAVDNVAVDSVAVDSVAVDSADVEETERRSRPEARRRSESPLLGINQELQELGKNITSLVNNANSTTEALTRALDLHNEITVMSVNLSTLDSESVEYFRYMKKMYTQKRLSQIKDNNN